MDSKMDSAELAELVALASDLTDVTDSDSETGRTGSTQTCDSSTMVTESLSVSSKTSIGQFCKAFIWQISLKSLKK